MSAAARKLVEVLEAGTSAVCAGIAGTSQRALVRERWLAWCRRAPRTVGEAALRETPVRAARGDEGRMSVERTERAGVAAVRRDAGRFRDEHGVAKTAMHAAIGPAEQWAKICANATCARARRKLEKDAEGRRIAESEHAKYLRLTQTARLERLDDAQWTHVAAAAPWMLSIALGAPPGAGPEKGTAWEWVERAVARSAQARGEHTQHPGAQAIREAAADWKLPWVRPPLTAVWAHACARARIEGDAMWDAAMECEARGTEGGADAFVEACARSAEEFEDRVDASLRQWWMMHTDAPRKWRKAQITEARWRSEEGTGRRRGKTQIAEHGGGLVWEVPLERPWAVLCAAREEDMEGMRRHTSMRVGALHEREWAHFAGWGQRNEGEAGEHAARANEAFIAWAEGTWG